MAGHTVFISEYNAPEDFECIIEVKTNTQMANGTKGGNMDKIEKLFKFVPRTFHYSRLSWVHSPFKAKEK